VPPRPALAIRRPSVQSRSAIGPIADWLTLLGLVLAPNGGLGFGGRLGIAYADIVFGLAAAARGLHLLLSGVPVAKLRRVSFLLGMLAVFCGAGLISGLVNGTPLSGLFIFTAMSFVGAVLLVATFGGDDHDDNVRRLVTAFAIGCAILGASSFYGPTAQDRSIGYAVHPNALGHSCIMGVGAAVWLFDRSKTLLAKGAWAFAAALAIGGIFQSGSRGGVLAIATMFTLYLALRGSLRAVLVGAFAAWLFAMVLATGAVHLAAGNPIARLIEGNPTTYGSDDARRELISGNLRDIGEDPLFGKGFGVITDIHVVYFQGWVGGGAIDAFVLMLLGLTMLLMPFWQRPKDLGLACAAAGIAVAWLFTNILTARDQWFYIGLVFSVSPSPLVLGRHIPAVRRPSS
jgi:hypothetical protein